MELLQLRTVLAVARTGNFTRASEELGISQSAVSHQISALEKELGVDLFIRARKRVTMTYYGELVHRYSEEIFRHANAIPQELKRAKTNSKKSIRISARLHSLGNPFNIIRRDFLRTHKNTEVYFQSAESLQEIIGRVKTGQAEVGIIGKRIEANNLRTIPYGEFRMIPVVGHKHRLAKMGLDLQLSSLVEEEWILFNKESRMRRLSDRVFSAEGFVPSRVYESNDGAILIDQIVTGNGIGLMPSWAITSEIKSGQLFEVNLGLEIRNPIYFVVAQSTDSPLVIKFVEFMKTNQLEGVTLFDKDSR